MHAVTHTDVCFGGTTETTLCFAKHTWCAHLITISHVSVGILQYIILTHSTSDETVHARYTNGLRERSHAKVGMR